jgi:hypothetical protein
MPLARRRRRRQIGAIAIAIAIATAIAITIAIAIAIATAIAIAIATAINVAAVNVLLRLYLAPKVAIEGILGDPNVHDVRRRIAASAPTIVRMREIRSVVAVVIDVVLWDVPPPPSRSGDPQ